MAVTIIDVAREAGVSVATVSRVFNSSGPVREETRRRVRDAARRLRYIPNGAARSLITRRTHTLGVVLPEVNGDFFSEVIRGIDQTARRSGYHLLISSSHSDQSGVAAALRAMRGRVDGLVIMSPDLDTRSLAAGLPEKLPVVLLNSGFIEDSPFDSLTIDNYRASYEVVRHLVAHGHRRIAMIKGPDWNRDAEERLQGYRAALREQGEWSEALERSGDFTESAGFRAAVELLEASERPTAIFAANDSMAVGALSALGEAGIRVPAEIALAGFDDIPIARYTNPPLTSVHVPISDLGARACARLLQVVEGKEARLAQHETLSTRLVVRGSCGCPGQGDRLAGLHL